MENLEQVSRQENISQQPSSKKNYLLIGVIATLVVLLTSSVLLFQPSVETPSLINTQSPPIVGEYIDTEYGIRVEILSFKEIEKGIELLARAWKGDTQLGFSKDGSVDIERFRIYNPPLLVDDPNGDIVREWTEEGITHTRTLREDPTEAIRKTLAHTISITGKTTGNIVKGKVGATTSTFFPDADPETNTIDGEVFRLSVDETFTNVRSGAGTTALDSGTTHRNQIRASATTDQYRRISRGITLFDTSGIPDTDSIDSAIYSLDSTLRSNDLSGESSPNSRVHVVASTPATNTALVNADYGQTGGTTFGNSVNQADVTNGTYEDITLNASGLAAISKTGITKLGTRVGWDLDNTTTGLTWASDGFQGIQWKSADTAGTTSDPKLVVVHSLIQGNNLSPPSIPEGGLQVIINNDEEETVSSPEVILTFRRNSDASKIAVSNDSKVLDTSIERIQDFKPWNLCLPARQQHLPTPEDCDSGTYTVYTRFYTEQLLGSKVVSDTIVYEKPEEEIVEDTGGQVQPEPIDSLPSEQPDPRLKEIREQIALIQMLLNDLQEQLNRILSQS